MVITIDSATDQTVRPITAKLSKTLSGENEIELVFVLQVSYQFAIGDSITWNTETYYLNKLPRIVKGSNGKYEYKAIFEAVYYDLKKVQFMYNGLNEFYFNGTLSDIMNIMMDNVHRVYGAGHLALEEVVETEFRSLYFQNMTCFEVLQEVISEWEMEFYFNGNTLYVQQEVGVDSGETFKYGYGQGLYKIERTDVNTKNLITRLYGMGSERNLTWNYRPASFDPRNLLKRAGAVDLVDAVDIDSNSTKTYLGGNRWKWVNNGGGASRIKLSVDHTLLVDNDPYFCTIYFAGNDNQDNLGLQWCDITPYTNDYDNVQGRMFATGSRVYDDTYDYMYIHLAVNAEVILYDAQIEATGYTVYDGGYALTSGRFNKRLLFDDPPDHYLESGVATYGVFEATKIFEDIYPRRTGRVTTIGTELEFLDSTMDFDVNDQLITGVKALVHFQTGNLAGYEFRVEVYEHSGNTLGDRYFKLIQTQNQQGYILPSSTGLRPAVNDEYVLLDIEMPTSYITTAETELQTATQAYLNENDSPRVSYNINVDPVYAKANALDFAIGDSVTIVDTDLNVNRLIRIITIIYDLTEEYKMDIKLADDIETSLVKAVRRGEKRVDRIISISTPFDAAEDRKKSADVIQENSSIISYTECPADSTTNIIIGNTIDASFAIHVISKRDMGTVQRHTGLIEILYDNVAGTVSYSPFRYVGPGLDYEIAADLNSGQIRLNIVVGDANTNALSFAYRITSKFYI